MLVSDFWSYKYGPKVEKRYFWRNFKDQFLLQRFQKKRNEQGYDIFWTSLIFCELSYIWKRQFLENDPGHTGPDYDHIVHKYFLCLFKLHWLNLEPNILILGQKVDSLGLSQKSGKCSHFSLSIPASLQKNKTFEPESHRITYWYFISAIFDVLIIWR